MSGATDIAVNLGMQENVTKQMPAVSQDMMALQTAIAGITAATVYLGSTMLSMSIALERSSNEAARAAGNYMAVAGGMMTAVGSAAHFIQAAVYVANALKRVNLQMVLMKALSGPWGWATLAGAAAFAGLSFYAVTSARGGSGGGTHEVEKPVEIRSTIVVDRQVLGETARTELLKIKQRNANDSGV